MLPSTWSFPFSFHDQIYKRISLVSKVPSSSHNIWSKVQIMELLGMKGDRNTGVDIATHRTARSSNPVWEGDFLFATPVQNIPGAHPGSCTINTETLSWGRSDGGRGVWHLSLTPSRAEVQSGYSCNSTPPLCIPGVLEGDLYLYSLHNFFRPPVTRRTLGSNIHLRKVTTCRKSVNLSLRRRIWFLQCFPKTNTD
jgi:hypothetical protein